MAALKQGLQTTASRLKPQTKQVTQLKNSNGVYNAIGYFEPCNLTKTDRDMAKNNQTADKTINKKRPAVAILLVIIESALSVALRLDKGLRQKVYPLVHANMRWSIRTYLPHVIVYVSFTPNGILLDSTPPDDEGEPDVIISGSLMAVVRSALLSDSRIISKLQFRGESEDISVSREFLANLGLQHVASNMFGRLRQIDKSENDSQEKLLVNYKSQIDEQQNTIDTLSTQLNTATQNITKQKRITGFLSMLCLVLTVVVIILGYLNYQ